MKEELVKEAKVDQLQMKNYVANRFETYVRKG